MRSTVVRTGRRLSPVIALALWVAAGVPAARAADAPAVRPRNVTVAGTGTAKGKPTVVELTAVVTGEAELAADAVVKHRDARRRGLAALEGLKIAALSVRSQGVAVNQAADPNAQQMMMRGQMPTGTPKPKVQVVEQLQFELTGADKLADDELINTILKIVDAARDAGLTIGPGGPRTYQQMVMMAQTGQSGGGMARYRIPDAAVVRAQAYERAMADARVRAQRLAELSGAKLGPVVSVQEGGDGDPTGGNPAMSLYRMMYAAQMQNQAQAEAGLSSETFGEIPMTVTLSVQFALE